MKKAILILVLIGCSLVLGSCVQDTTGTTNWFVVVRSSDTIRITVPVYDYIEGKYGGKQLTSIEQQKVDSGSIVVCGDVYLCGNYRWSSKGNHKYRYTERQFILTRLTNHGEIKAFVVSHGMTPQEYGWLPSDVNERDIVFENLILHYGKDIVQTMSVEQTEIEVVCQP